MYHSVPSVKPSKPYSRGSVVMVDEMMNASPSKFRFPEAGLRVMVTSHFGPKTRLRMASRLIITEVNQPFLLQPMGLLELASLNNSYTLLMLFVYYPTSEVSPV